MGFGFVLGGFGFVFCLFVWLVGWLVGFLFLFFFLCRMVIEEGSLLKVRKDPAIETTMKLGTRVPPTSKAWRQGSLEKRPYEKQWVGDCELRE